MKKTIGNSNLFLTLQKKLMIYIFRASLFIKRFYDTLLVTFNMFKHVKVGKHIGGVLVNYE